MAADNLSRILLLLLAVVLLTTSRAQASTLKHIHNRERPLMKKQLRMQDRAAQGNNTLASRSTSSGATPRDELENFFCKVTNANQAGEGSFRDCIEQADAAPGGITFKITFSRRLRGWGSNDPAVIPQFTADEQSCDPFHVENRDLSVPSVTAPKVVSIVGSRSRKPSKYVTIDASPLVCNDDIFLFETDVSVKMSGLRILGRYKGDNAGSPQVFILVDGGSGDSAVRDRVPIVILENMVLTDCGNVSVEVADAATIRLTNVDVLNGRLEAFENGEFFFKDFTEISITNCNFSGNGRNGILAEITENPGRMVVKNSVIDRNGIEPDRGGDSGIEFDGARDGGFETEFVLDRVTVTRNTDCGVEIFSTQTTIIRQSVLSGNGGANEPQPDEPAFNCGLLLVESTADITESDFSDNESYGITLEARDSGILAQISNFQKNKINNNRFGAFTNAI